MNILTVKEMKMNGDLTRRLFIIAGASSIAARPQFVAAATSFRLGLTPVFLDNDAVVIDKLRSALSAGMERPIELIQRRTYEEVTGLLLEGAVDAAWLCGYPFLQHVSTLSLVGVPVWQGKPLYQSYLIVSAGDDGVQGLEDLKNGTHAYSDPDSNSGWLVTASDIVRLGARPDSFFSRSIFTYGHRNVVRAVASGLTRSGSVDGYVWEVLKLEEPDLAERTRVVTKSEWLGFPPIVARKDRVSSDDIVLLRDVLQRITQDELGRQALSALHLDAVRPGSFDLYDGIAARMSDVSVFR